MTIKTTKNNDALDELLAMVLGKIAATPGNILSAIVKIAKHKGSLRPEKIEVNQLLKEERGLEITDTNFRKNLQKINEAFKEVANTQTPASIKSRGAVLEIDLGDFIDTQVSRNIERPSKSIIPSESNIPPQVISGKRTVSIFISHAWENDPILDEVTREFHQKLKNKLENLPESWRDKYQFKLWIDFENIKAVAAPNNNLKRQFVCKAQEAEFGIMLFSDKWFCSKDCQLEASKFYDKNGEILADKLVIQIALNRNIDKKYKKHPILPKLYGKYKTLPSLLKSDNCNDITDFFDNIRDEICCSLDKQTPPEPSKNTIKERLKYNDQYCHIDKVTNKGTESNNSNEKFEVIPKLIQWAKFDDPEKPIVTALLGDFGAGKTTTCQMLTQELWKQHAQDANNPAPIYFDLRNLITFFADQNNVDTSVETLLEKLIAVTGAQKITGIEVIDYLKDRNTLIIFDGLDEIGNSLGEAKLAEIYRKLLSIIPEKHWQQQPSDKDAEVIITKILVTCRTHFWRDNLQQQSVLSAQGRSKLNQDSPQSKVKVFYLAPFDKEQIEEFLRKKLPEQELKSALQFINNAHDLSDIAKKPLMLNFIFEQLSTLLQAYQSGKIINVATIYHLLFAKTLDRDEGKNLKIMPRSKDRMLQKLALYLWQEQSKSLSTNDLYDWFDDYLLTVNDLIINTQEDRNLLFTELHNASLLVRDDSHYRFSHTSFFEYFQARNIFETLLKTDNSLADLPIDKPISAESLDFVHQIYADSGNSKQEKLQQSLSRYLTYDANTDKQASKVLRTFLAKLLLQGQSSPAPIPFPKQVDFSYLDLPNLAFIGSEKTPLDLQNAHFEHSDLSNTTFTSVLLNNAVFTNSRLDYCKFDSCYLINSCFVNQDIDQCQLTGAKFHQCVLTGAKLGQVDDSCFFIDSLDEPAKQRSIVADKLTMSLEGNSQINSVVISTDNRFIVSAGDDGSVCLWDRKTQQSIGSPLQGHSGRVHSVAISADNRFIVSAGDDETVLLWDRKTQQPIGSPLQGHSDIVNSVAISIDNRFIVSASSDGSVRLWDRKTQQPIGSPLQGCSGFVHSVAISTDNRFIVSASGDGSVLLWDRKTQQPIGLPLQGHSGSVYSVAISTDNRFIVSAGYDKTVRLWDRKTQQPIGSPLQGHSGMVYSVAISADNRFIASASDDKTVRLWDRKTQQPIGSLLQEHGGSVYSVAISADNRFIASARFDGSVRLWDRKTQKPIGSPLKGHNGFILSVAISADNRFIVSTSDKTVRLWDRKTQQPIGSPLQGHSDLIRSVAISTDNRFIVSAGDDKTVRLWDRKTRQLIGSPLQKHNDRVFSVAISADNRFIVSADIGGTVRLWDRKTQQPIGSPLQGHSSSGLSVAISADNRFIVSAGDDKTVCLWDRKTQQLIGSLLQGYDDINSVAISADSRFIVSADMGGAVCLWDRKTQQPISSPLQGYDDNPAAISADNRFIFSADMGGTVCFCDRKTQQTISLPLQKDGICINSVAISADSRFIVSARDDKTIRLWDRKTQQPIGSPLQGHSGMVFSVAISADSRFIVSAGDDGSVRLWDRKTQKCLGIHYALDNNSSFCTDGNHQATYWNPNDWDKLYATGQDENGETVILSPSDFPGYK